MMGNDLAVLEDTELEEVVSEPLSAAKAKQLDKRIRTARDKVTTDMESLVALVNDAREGQIHVGLGLRSWAEWAKDALHFSFSFDQRIERKEFAKMLSNQGLSQHTIAKMFGVSQKTVGRDLEGEEFDSDTVTATDGRELPRNRNGSEADSEIIEGEVVDDVPEPPVKQPSVSEDFEAEVFQLQNDIEALKEVVADDRFPKARKRIATKHLDTLQEIKGEFEAIIDEVFGA